MIQPTRQTTRRLNRKAVKQKADSKAVAQMTTNAVLWQIIEQHRGFDEEGNPVEGNMVMTIPHEELKGVPTNFSLEVKQTSDGTIITAKTVEQKSSIILPNQRIVN